jgi:hypothetical protein
MVGLPTILNPVLYSPLTMLVALEPNLAGYNLDIPEDVQDFESDTARWVDAHAFQARCTAAGFDEGFKYRFTHAGGIIAIGLETGYPGGLETKLDCHIMAAAQYILHAGDVIDGECVRQRRSPPRQHSWKGFNDGNGPVVWKQWGRRLSEIAEALESGKEPGFKVFEKNREALADMVIKARDKMVALEPELFAQPDLEPGSELEPGQEPKQELTPEPNPESRRGPTPTSESGPRKAEGSDPPRTLRSMLDRFRQKVKP